MKTKKMATKSTSIVVIRGGYVLIDEYDHGFKIADAICAYEDAEDIAIHFCEERCIPLHAMHMVCGWDEADELLEQFGFDVDECTFIEAH